MTQKSLTDTGLSGVTWSAADSSKGNLTGTGSYDTPRYTQQGNIVRATITGISNLSVTSSGGLRTYVIFTPTGLPVSGGAYNYLSGHAWAANTATDLAVMARVGASGTNIIIDWTSTSSMGTGGCVIYNFELVYQIVP